MIVPMKKVAIIVQSKDADITVKRLRSLGVLHVEHQAEPKGKGINAINEDIASVDEALGILSAYAQKKNEPQKTPQDFKTASRHIIRLSKRLSQLQEYSISLKVAISQWQDWGDFDPDVVKSLAENNIFVKFYSMPTSQIKDLPGSVIVKKISEKAGMANCVLISRQKVDIPFKEMMPPKMGLAKMRKRLAEDSHVIKTTQDDIKRHSCFIEGLKAAKKQLENDLEFRNAVAGMGLSDEIAYLAGYIPYDAERSLRQAGQDNRWALVITDPSGEDNVPTLIRNVRWVQAIKPVFRLLEIVPGYKELDISPAFLCFLSLFFGMIIADAGYGALYFLLTFLAHIRFGKKTKDKKVFFLFYIFSGCAIFWGLLTGTVFGQEWYLKAGFKPFAPVLNDTKFLQAFCFFLGAFHLSLAHTWCGLRKLPSAAAISDAGWICVLWAAFLAAKTLILNDPFPYFGKWLIMTGLVLAILFTNPQRNIFMVVASGIGAISPLNLINFFTDVVSYIRLFAVGLAGIAISDTVNTLAADTSGIAAIVIVFLGHTINIVLGPLSVLVHGIRLNVLEFSGHAGLSWSGIAYKPLKEG
jgi:V/A-type H+-transporting ATPase subunit I